MIIYIAGDGYGKEIFHRLDYRFNRLDSFYYVLQNDWLGDYAARYDRYMLDSGAFTFISGNQKNRIDIDSFTDQYIEYVQEKQVDLFFEMDVDVVYGYDKVRKLRNHIEQRVGKPTIPVFHLHRGLEDWKAMIRDYKYIALGMTGKEISKVDWRSLQPFVYEAKSQGCKVHGLGITGMRVLKKVAFDSVDSSSWTAGNQYRLFYVFDGKELKISRHRPKGPIVDHIGLGMHNIKQFIHFGKYMENRQTV